MWNAGCHMRGGSGKSRGVRVPFLSDVSFLWQTRATDQHWVPRGHGGHEQKQKAAAGRRPLRAADDRGPGGGSTGAQNAHTGSGQHTSSSLSSSSNLPCSSGLSSAMASASALLPWGGGSGGVFGEDLRPRQREPGNYFNERKMGVAGRGGAGSAGSMGSNEWRGRGDRGN